MTNLCFSENDLVNRIPFVGPTYVKKLENLNIYTVKDLLFHYPAKYSDSREIISIQELVLTGQGTIQCQIVKIRNIKTRRGMFLTTATAQDETGKIEVIWFNQPFLTKTIKKGSKYLLKGKINKKYGRITFSNPEYELFQEEMIHLGKLAPVYPETYGVTTRWLRARINHLRPFIKTLITDYLSEDIRKEQNLLELSTALEKIHFPKNDKDIKEGEERLGLDELVNIQLQAQKIIGQRNKEKAASIKGNYKSKTLAKLFNNLGFKLTKCQKASIKEILEDIGKDTPMERLLNGDVGSGKTVVALAGAVSVFENGYSTIIMAPTTILANQHYNTINQILKRSKVKIPVKLITSRYKDELTENPQIIVSTHAILYQSFLPKNVAFSVVDEEHRFGVEQRKKVVLNLKGVHRLTMTATPIPRTLTMAIYGEKNVSVLDELPTGRRLVKTYIISETKRKKAYDWIKKRLDRKEQLFVIHSLIESSEKIEAKAAKEEYENLVKAFKKYKVGLVHGKLSEKKKNEQINLFKEEKTDVLVATPVVEVGIDIPNATMMIIENAERFGLAQLHQFRGRVGRNEKQSYCFLFYSSKSADVKERLKFFSQNPNGFKVAEYDLKRRGPGEVYGIKQSGLLHFRYADISDPAKIKKASLIAKELTQNG